MTERIDDYPELPDQAQEKQAVRLNISLPVSGVCTMGKS